VIGRLFEVRTLCFGSDRDESPRGRDGGILDAGSRLALMVQRKLKRRSVVQRHSGVFLKETAAAAVVEMIVLRNISKTFEIGGRSVRAIAPVSLTIRTGSAFGIIGPSGAGKSTLLRLVNRLEEPSAGQVFVDGMEITSLAGPELRRARRLLGMVFQGYNLMANRTVLRNVTFPLEISGMSFDVAHARALDCLRLVHLEDRADAHPAQLSGGQKQRVAIARAIAPRPAALLCDEPTSALDPETAESVLATLAEINRDLGVTLVVVTHSMDVVRRLCDTVAVMEQGVIVEQLDLRDPVISAKSSFARHLIGARARDGVVVTAGV